MQLTTFLATTLTILGLAAASPTENDFAGSDLAFVKRGKCDCPAVQACCRKCFENTEGRMSGEKCCNNKCLAEFPECYNAC